MKIEASQKHETWKFKECVLMHIKHPPLFERQRWVFVCLYIIHEMKAYEIIFLLVSKVFQSME